MAETEPAQVNVTWEDQKKICTFGRLHQRALEIRGDITEKEGDIEKITDAESEIYIADDVKLTVGECFVQVEPDFLEDLLGEKKAALEGQLAQLQGELGSLEEAMKGLKAQLYAKFGKNIYLENE
eukprot:TRINITY_DN72064_c0_g1_i1.p1 TRINITY_DN72064_c0_g1~~TRINITY_DN72064_c0_g1_i1.p1  ORF type:complete len:125 (+),score=59.27 TRINITY_DN72064_c0_g1_i1:72-446(+)